jgi:hypothetical protein
MFGTPASWISLASETSRRALSYGFETRRLATVTLKEKPGAYLPKAVMIPKNVVHKIHTRHAIREYVQHGHSDKLSVNSVELVIRPVHLWEMIWW